MYPRHNDVPLVVSKKIIIIQAQNNVTYLYDNLPQFINLSPQTPMVISCDNSMWWESKGGGEGGFQRQCNLDVIGLLM